ncbi:MAG: hypothetical protein VX252_13740 [Myxococcota bacterium]|nr:hypothetical protein [Myxococcota bacterium]
MTLVSGEEPGAQPAPASRSFWAGLLALALLALILRLIHIFSMDAHLGEAQIHDALYYQDTALAWVLDESESVNERPFANQGYIGALKLVYGTLGSGVMGMLWIQAFLGSWAVFLVGLAARRLFGSEGAGLLAAGWLALYAPAIHFDALLLIPSLSLFLSAVGIYCFARVLESESRSGAYALALGICIALSAALRPSQWLLVPLCILAFLWVRPVLSRSQGMGVAFAFVLGLVLGFSPLALEQRVRVGEWIPVSANAGMNLWTGNHIGASGTYQVAPFLPYPEAGKAAYTIPSERDAFWLEARQRSGGPTLSLPGASTFWLLETGREVAEAPREWLRLMGRKFFALMNNAEPRTNADFALTSHVSPLLGHDPVRFGLLMLFATLGIVLLRPGDRRVVAVLAPFVLAPFLTCLLFFVSAEYRHPAAPALAVLAGWGLLQTARTLRGRATLSLAPAQKLFGVAALLTVTVLAYLPMEPRFHHKDARAYADVLSSPDFRNEAPEREDYERARRLLRDPTIADDPMVMTSLLLTESNFAVQFKDPEAARNFIAVDKALWKLDDQTVEDLGPHQLDRIRRSQMLRSALLCTSPHVRQWTRIMNELQSLGCTSWQPVGIYLEKGDLASAEIYLTQAEWMAYGAPELLAYRGWLEKKKGEDPVPFLQAGVEAFPRIALPAILLARHYEEEAEWLKARQYATIAMRREPQNPALVITARRILNANPWTRSIEPEVKPDLP